MTERDHEDTTTAEATDLLISAAIAIEIIEPREPGRFALGRH